MKNVLWICSLILILGGCQKEIIHEKTITSPNASASPGTVFSGTETQRESSGTVDGGGGNGVKGRPLESYRINTDRLLEGLPRLQMTIEAVEKIFPPLAGDMLHIIRDRSWYMIPVNLDKLPSTKIGVYFTTEQIALQNLREIWLDSRIFDSMKDDDKTLISLHEILMGVRLMEFTSALDNCLSEASQDLLKSSKSHKYDDKRRFCYKTYSIDIGSSNDEALGLGNTGRSAIQEKDYSNIRTLTTTLFNSADKMTTDELIAWLKANHFRKY